MKLTSLGLSTARLLAFRGFDGYGPRHSRPKPFRYINRFNSKRQVPYTSAQEVGPHGANHPSILLPRRPRNERDFTHARWRRA